MKATGKNIFKMAIFVILLATILFEVNRILTLKAVEARYYSPVSEYNGFYQMEEDSVDVLFLGSSHCYCSFSPQDIYNYNNIRSYNLGSSQQSIWLSYYWLEEALSYQKPEVVVLEILFATAGGGLGGDEPSVRKALDYMKWSNVKREAITMASQLYESITPISFYLPNIRYHERWKELGEDDFSYNYFSDNFQLKGYAPLGGKYGQDEYINLDLDSEEVIELNSIVNNYLDKIVSLCNENNIKLILVKTPTIAWSTLEHNTITQYAKQKGIEFYDFNTKELYAQLGYEFPNDSQDYGHPNVWGAKKISDMMGEILEKNYGVSGVIDSQWESTVAFSNNVKKDKSLQYVTDINSYLEMINDERYTIFISVKNDASALNCDDIVQRMNDLGLQAEGVKGSGNSYLAVISNEEKYEECGELLISKVGTFRNGKSRYQISSAGMNAGNISTILIDGYECSKNMDGLNLAVYNNHSRELIDSVCFNIVDSELVAKR